MFGRTFPVKSSRACPPFGPLGSNPSQAGVPAFVKTAAITGGGAFDRGHDSANGRGSGRLISAFRSGHPQSDGSSLLPAKQEKCASGDNKQHGNDDSNATRPAALGSRLGLSFRRGG